MLLNFLGMQIKRLCRHDSMKVYRERTWFLENLILEHLCNNFLYYEFNMF